MHAHRLLIDPFFSAQVLRYLFRGNASLAENCERLLRLNPSDGEWRAAGVVIHFGMDDYEIWHAAGIAWGSLFVQKLWGAAY